MYSAIIFVTLVAAASPSALPSYIFENRIVNGTDAADGEFPFAVSIRRSNNNVHVCGGTILTPFFVLTAAHCVLSRPESYNVLYGTNRLMASGPTVLPVRSIKIHAQFNPFRSPENDIGVVRLMLPMIFGPRASAVPLPYQGQFTRGGSPATTIGWGLDQTGGNLQTNLQKVDYFVTELHICIAVHNITVFQSNICTHYPGGGRGQCNGDSGGAVLVNGQQVGIVSWSEKPCGGPYPGVSTSVAAFRNWIAENTVNDGPRQ